MGGWHANAALKAWRHSRARQKNQVAGTPENRYYKLRFLDANEKPVGLESQVLRIIALID